MLCLELFVVRILHAVHLSGRVRVCQSAVPHVDTGGAVTERSVYRYIERRVNGSEDTVLSDTLDRTAQDRTSISRTPAPQIRKGSHRSRRTPSRVSRVA